MKRLLLCLALTACAGAAKAQSALRPADILAQAILAAPARERAAARLASRPGLDLSRPAGTSRYANPLPPGIAKTSIDHRFDDDGAVGSAGYLCGLHPGQKQYGAAGAAGYDPMGKFLGAKLSIAFR